MSRRSDEVTEQLFSSIREADTVQAEECIRYLIGDSIDVNCTYLMNTFSINGCCESRKQGHNIVNKLYAIFKDTFVIHTHGLRIDGDEIGYYINLKDRNR